MSPQMRSSFPIAVLCALGLGLASIASAIATTPVHAHRRAAAKAHETGHKAAAKAGTRVTSKVPARKSANAKSRRSEAQSGRAARNIRGKRTRVKAPLPEVQAVRLSIPAPLRGSHESLVHQNEMAEADGLERILDDSDLNDRIASGSLVPVPVSSTLTVNTDLPENRRYCRPWTAKFLADLSQAHAARFARATLEVTSAVRTVEYQRQLRHINGNAAAADGDIASPHLTGGTIDIAKAGMSAREIGWIRAWLIPLEQQGKIDVEEEFRQSCFHISVYKSYSEPKAPEKAAPLNAASMLAAHGR